MMLTLSPYHDEVFEAERVDHLAVEREAKNFCAAWPRPIDAARNSIANIIRRDMNHPGFLTSSRTGHRQYLQMLDALRSTDYRWIGTREEKDDGQRHWYNPGRWRRLDLQAGARHLLSRRAGAEARTRICRRQADLDRSQRHLLRHDQGRQLCKMV